MLSQVGCQVGEFVLRPGSAGRYPYWLLRHGDRE